MLRGLVSERWSDWRQQKSWDVPPLEAIMLATIRDAERAVIRDSAYLRIFGLDEKSCTAGRLWRHLFEQALASELPAEFGTVLAAVMQHGSLATRIGRALGPAPDRARIAAVYESLCACLQRGVPFGLDPGESQKS